jgi:hypothetical protein
MISATDVADADAETRTSDDAELASEDVPMRAGDRARAKFCAIVEGRARLAPSARIFPLFEDEEAVFPDIVDEGGSGGDVDSRWVSKPYTTTSRGKAKDNSLDGCVGGKFRYAVPLQIH